MKGMTSNSIKTDDRNKQTSVVEDQSL